MSSKPRMPSTSEADPLWTVTCEFGSPLAPTVKALRDTGFQVTDVLDEIGIVNGHAPAAMVPRLQALKGVADVSPTLGFSLGPEPV
jgi:hypothetical protein